VIHNLLDNGIKYTRQNPKITISTANEENRIKIAVSDNGIGLSPEEQKHIFDKYYRVSTGNVHDVKGFGLGLSYVKLIAKAHNGSVQVKSEWNNGSVFEIDLPLPPKKGPTNGSQKAKHKVSMK
jgi:two-component system phosphate regulon sensor histidine kinase PhoR